MEKTIGQLFEIEEKANLIINRATEEKASLHDDFEKENIRIEETIASNNVQKLKDLQAQTDVDLTNEIKALIINTEKRLSDLEEINIKKHEILVNQVFENIIRS